MERVIAYLESQSDIDRENIKKFKEEVIEYEKTNPSESIWDKIEEYIEEANGDNDQFLVLLEENYKDLSTHLFNAQFGILDDFQNSDSDHAQSDDENNDNNKLYTNGEKDGFSYETETKDHNNSKNVSSDAAINDEFRYHNIYDDNDDQKAPER